MKTSPIHKHSVILQTLIPSFEWIRGKKEGSTSKCYVKVKDYGRKHKDRFYTIKKIS